MRVFSISFGKMKAVSSNNRFGKTANRRYIQKGVRPKPGLTLLYNAQYRVHEYGICAIWVANLAPQYADLTQIGR